MRLAEILAALERRAADAERIGATAPVAAVLRDVAAELTPLVNGNGTSAPERTPVASTDGGLLTAREVAKRLGCSVRYVYAHANDWPFTVRLDGRAVRFDPEGLARWTRRRG